jgi:cell fate (sporulation/competence/biofilm development) regulator YlbF (YheA/YmcA/DUF963 family)
MDIELINKIDELLNIFEESKEIKNLSLLKKNIYNNLYIKNKINYFNKIKDNPYSSEVISLRKELLNNEEIKEYKQLENELLLITMAINKKLNNLVKKEGCKHENN